MKNKILVSALVAIAAISSTSVAFANVNSGPDLYVGLQGGYGDTHWDNLIISDRNLFVGSDQWSVKGTGLAGRAYVGSDYNQYLGIESGFTYFPKTTVKYGGTDLGSFKTYGVDLLGKISVPVAQNFGLFAKAGPGYLNSDHVHNVDFVYGLGADYAFTPKFVADVSFLRYNGNNKLTPSKYQPDADLFSAGLAYKFNIS